MKSRMKKWIESRLNEGKPVQVACTYSNTCRWNYLTTSGKVCREEFGYEEDTEDIWLETFDLPVMSWHSVKRLQKALENEGNY